MTIYLRKMIVGVTVVAAVMILFLERDHIVKKYQPFQVQVCYRKGEIYPII